MKIFLFVACLIAISCAADVEKLKKFYDDYANCRNKFNVPQWTPDVVKCMLRTYDLIDEQGLIKKEELLKNYENTISDKNTLNQAKEFSSKCIDQAYQGSGSNEEKMMTIIQCIMPVKDLVDKLQ